MKAIRTTFIILFSATFLTGCYKAGCTNPDANNFDPDVKTDDLSCTYTGNIVFWAPYEVSDSLINLGHTMLRFELEGEIKDSIATSTFNSTAGGCNTTGTKTFPMDFSGNTKWKYKYRIKGYDFVTIYEGYIEAKANDCVEVQLDYP